MTEPLNFAEDCQNQSVVNIDCFGASPDLLDNSQAIQEAINYCAANNYSKVVITGKKQYTISSPIVIKSNVHLEMDPTVTLIVKGDFQVFELQKTLQSLVVRLKLWIITLTHPFFTFLVPNK